MQKRQNNYNNHTDHDPGNEVEYYPDEGGANSHHGYIKYNSMATAKYWDWTAVHKPKEQKSFKPHVMNPQSRTAICISFPAISWFSLV